jgi:hypothetical protein
VLDHKGWSNGSVCWEDYWHTPKGFREATHSFPYLPDDVRIRMVVVIDVVVVVGATGDGTDDNDDDGNDDDHSAFTFFNRDACAMGDVSLGVCVVCWRHQMVRVVHSELPLIG